MPVCFEITFMICRLPVFGTSIIGDTSDAGRQGGNFEPVAPDAPDAPTMATFDPVVRELLIGMVGIRRWHVPVPPPKGINWAG